MKFNTTLNVANILCPPKGTFTGTYGLKRTGGKTFEGTPAGEGPVYVAKE